MRHLMNTVSPLTEKKTKNKKKQTNYNKARTEKVSSYQIHESFTLANEQGTVGERTKTNQNKKKVSYREFIYQTPAQFHR